MDPELLTAIVVLISTIVSAVGAVATLLINNSRLEAKDKALGTAMTSSVVNAVKATAQTITAGARDNKGNLPDTLKQAARQEAITQAKIILGSDKLAQAQSKYGVEGLDKVLVTLLEAVLHDVKSVKATTVQSTSVATPSEDGSLVTTTVQASTSAMEIPPPR